MNCCLPPVHGLAETSTSPATDEIKLASRALGHGLYQTDLSVPGVHCAGCIRTVEGGLLQVAGVEYARVNLSTKRVSVRWRGEQAPPLLDSLENLGFPAHLFETEDDRTDPELERLIRALAVSGFTAMNIMLLSVSVWSGAAAETRLAFHWISAGLAMFCLGYSGRVFFASAWNALRHGRTNMDVPISVGVCLAYCLSLYDTINDGPHAYFDAATSLIFFLLVGRALDHVMREKARSAVRGLTRLLPRGAVVLGDDGGRAFLPVGDIQPGMRILLAAGDRVPVDGTVEKGCSELDCALATGESAPRLVEPGSSLRAGTLNLTGALTVVATARAEQSFLAEMVRLMEAAEGGRARYRRLADRMARLYSPIVHATALFVFIGWMALTGDWHRATSIAIVVLIITCPCALGLAVPIVQVMAARRLFENGIMVKDGSAIERLAEIDTVAFDKTGTLTSGNSRLVDAPSFDRETLAIAASLGSHSKHPRSRALAAFADGQRGAAEITGIREEAGCGIEGRIGGKLYRLGRADWALAGGMASGTVLGCDDHELVTFQFEEQLRGGALVAVQSLLDAGIDLQILSGDVPSAVEDVASSLGLKTYMAELLPGEKVQRLAELAQQGRKVLMVGDGLNDAPSLAAAHVSMAPVTAADIGRNAADLVFLHDDLGAVPLALAVARAANRLVRQNFVLAIVYNAIALPVAITGHVTPLIAALSMSASSLAVILNALRLTAGNGGRRREHSVVAARSETERWAPAR